MNALEILSELKQEFVSTKNLLDIIPENRLNFKPHEKAMSLGQLAYHVAEVTGRMLSIGKDGEIEVDVLVSHPIPNSKKEILSQFDKSVKIVEELLSDDDTSWLNESWKLTKDGTVLAEMPTMGYVRTFVCNHLIHHRGELVAYLRQIDQIIPSIYGPTADVNPFA